MSEKKERNTILIVDDEPDIVRLTEKFLKLGEFETITCNNGRDAMEIVKKKHDEIALILLDIMMPGTSGYSVLKEIKDNDRFKDIIVVLFTVKSFNEDIQKGKRLGADGYLTKPFSGKELLKYVKEKLSN
ncbi:MAG: response regulator [Candidatus Lokiarchaeota archaeon]|nr:response regulator [Candidatus Lokiarchaeota archaeon]MBD3339980.1 response regulator [Candidatus Lokiarchaeota archaeon]